MNTPTAQRLGLLALLASVAFVAACEEKAPPPVPGKSSGGSGDITGAARGVRDMVKNTKGAIEESQQRTSDAANDIAAGGNSQAGKSFGLSGVEFTIQPGWTALTPENDMRKADLLYKGSSGEAHAVFFTLGGTADDNLNRWARQIETDSGDQPKITSESSNGLTIKRIDARGTYRGMSGAGMPASPEPNSRFIGVVIEGGRGSIQIRLVGPEQVINEAKAGFDAMLRNLRKS